MIVYLMLDPSIWHEKELARQLMIFGYLLLWFRTDQILPLTGGRCTKNYSQLYLQIIIITDHYRFIV